MQFARKIEYIRRPEPCARKFAVYGNACVIGDVFQFQNRSSVRFLRDYLRFFYESDFTRKVFFACGEKVRPFCDFIFPGDLPATRYIGKPSFFGFPRGR